MTHSSRVASLLPSCRSSEAHERQGRRGGLRTERGHHPVECSGEDILEAAVVELGLEHLGQDPETRTMESGKKVTHFTLATDDSYKNSEGQKVNETTWHNIVAWNGLADIAGKY